MDAKLARLYLLRMAPFFTISITEYLGVSKSLFFPTQMENRKTEVNQSKQASCNQ